MPPPSSARSGNGRRQRRWAARAGIDAGDPRGYALTEPDQTHAVRLLGSFFHGYVSLEMGGGFSHSARHAGDLGADAGRPRRAAAELARERGGDIGDNSDSDRARIRPLVPPESSPPADSGTRQVLTETPRP